jgi:preprotein translocase subunit SecG
MPILKTILLSVQALSGVLLIILVLLHSPKEGGFSGLGSSVQKFGTQKEAEKTLNQITYTLVGIFFTLAFITGFYL